MKADTDPTDNLTADNEEIVDALEESERKAGGVKPLRQDGTGGLTAIQVARRLGMSVPWVKLHTPELRGRKTKQGYRYPANLTIEKVREVLNFKSYNGKRVTPTKDDVASETARIIFAELRKGTTTAQIVERFGYHPKVVREYAAEWVRCGQFDNHDFAIIHGRRQPDAPAPVVFSPPTANVGDAARPSSEETSPPVPAARPSVTERLVALRREIESEGSEGESK